MNISFLLLALPIISVATNLTVEGIKKLLDKNSADYSKNLIAVIVAVIISCGVCAGYMILNDILFTLKNAVFIVILAYLSFLVATVGYDKVMQMLNQITKKEE